MEQQKPMRPQQRYVPAETDLPGEILSLRRRFPIALKNVPEQICGIAYRVGWTSKMKRNQALFRLRLNMDHANYGTATLPNLYILEDGIFVEYLPADDPPKKR